MSDLLTSCLIPCNFAPSRFEGTGVLQWHLWLPVPHLSLHGGPAGTAPGGGLTGLAGDDGGRWERGAALPGPGLNGGGSDWMAPKSNGTVSPRFTPNALVSPVTCLLNQLRQWVYVLCRHLKTLEKVSKNLREEVLVWRWYCGALEKLSLKYHVQWVGLCFLCTTMPQSRKKNLVTGVSSQRVEERHFCRNHALMGGKMLFSIRTFH